MSQYWEGTVYEQPSEDKIRKNAADTVQKEKKKGKTLSPVIITGRTIAKEWWGKAWCENLERYADYESRLDRGKRYVRTGAVINLQIQKGKVSARVQGRRKTPYKVEIKISPLSEERCQKIITLCGNKIQNLEALMEGNFPEELREAFLQQGGLFPEPKEISFGCSCPDWALMCKHVAAVLYGVGARFDENPLLFFELRGLDVGRLIDVTLADRVEKMLENADRPSERIIQREDYLKIFGF
ncbi:MAG: hypothetical protein HDQ97_03635 [Lachnospiraceae bacterium]|nr:hypothetical protein [Lachnospiraceae bacterium]